jgi:hypothetical protein
MYHHALTPHQLVVHCDSDFLCLCHKPLPPPHHHHHHHHHRNGISLYIPSLSLKSHPILIPLLLVDAGTVLKNRLAVMRHSLLVKPESGNDCATCCYRLLASNPHTHTYTCIHTHTHTQQHNRYRYGDMFCVLACSL